MFNTFKNTLRNMNYSLRKEQKESWKSQHNWRKVNCVVCKEYGYRSEVDSIDAFRIKCEYYCFDHYPFKRELKFLTDRYYLSKKYEKFQ